MLCGRPVDGCAQAVSSEVDELRRREDGTSRSALASSAASLASATANLYSRGRAAMDRELALRRRAIALVSEFVGERAWGDVVPVQYGAPTFAFLFEAEAEV